MLRISGVFNYEKKKKAHTLFERPPSPPFRDPPNLRRRWWGPFTMTLPQVSKSVVNLLRLPADMQTFCCKDTKAADMCAFQAAVMLATQKAEPGKKAVFYFREDRKPSVIRFANVLVRTVPVNKQTLCIDEEALNTMIGEDITAGFVPSLVCASIGLMGPYFGDNVQFLHSIAKSFGLVLHIEGPGQFLMSSGYAETEKLLKVFHDPEVAIAMTIPMQQLLGFAGSAVPCSLALTRVPVAGEQILQDSAASAADTISLYAKFKSLGLASARAAVINKVDEAAYLLSAMSNCGCVQMLTDPTNIFNIRFRFTAPASESQVFVPSYPLTTRFLRSQ